MHSSNDSVHIMTCDLLCPQSESLILVTSVGWISFKSPPSFGSSP